MYLAYLDESGSHGRLHNSAYVLAGVVVHEGDVARLEHDLTAVLRRHLADDVDDYEIHAAEIHRPKRDADSPWQGLDGETRATILADLITALAAFEPEDPRRLFELHGALAEPDSPGRERDAYETILNGIDDAVTRNGGGERMIAISDVSDHERQIQIDAAEWRRVVGRLGRLDRMVDVPLFTDSRSSRALQCADLVAWALWRRFGSERPNRTWVAPLSRHFEVRDGAYVGLRRVTATAVEPLPDGALVARL